MPPSLIELSLVGVETRPPTLRLRTRFVPRVLILTATVGEGHDLPARTLAAQLRDERPDVEVVTEDGLAPMGRLIKWISADSGRIVFFRFQWLWDVGFWFFAVSRPTRVVTQALLAKLGGGGLMRLIERVDPDVIVSTYPNTTEVLARLRRSAADPCAGVFGHHGSLGAALLGEPRHRHPSRCLSTVG